MWSEEAVLGAPPAGSVVDTKVPARTPANLRGMMAEAQAAMKTVVDSVAHLPVPDPAKPSFDRNAYQRAYMRKRRAAAKQGDG